MNIYHYLLAAMAALCLFSNSAAAQETAPGDVCTAGEENFTIQVGGPETTGVLRFLRCNGTNWENYITLKDDQISIGVGTTTADSSGFIAIGTNAGKGITDPDTLGGVAIGAGALGGDAVAPPNGNRNIAIGGGALGRLTGGGESNIAIGASAAFFCTGGNYNTFIGALIGDGTCASVSNNVIVGNNSGNMASAALNNVVIGSEAGNGADNQILSGNILIGYDIEPQTSPSASNELNIGNVIFGDLTGAAADGTGTAKVGINNNDPQYALDVTGDVNIPLDNAYRIDDLPMFQLYPSASGTVPSIAIGTGVTHTIEAPNQFATALIIGYGAGEDISGGSDKQHTLVGQYAGANITTASRVTALGYNAASNTNGSDLVAIGFAAGNKASAGATYVGRTAGHHNTGSFNVAVGSSALAGVDGSSTGTNNTAIGVDAGNDITTGAQNVFLGMQAGETVTTGSSNIIIGYDTDPSAVGANNELNIGGTIFGNLSTDQVGIGVTSAATIAATAALEVASTSRGFLPPRMADPNAGITGEVAGLMAYDSTDNELQYYNGTSWVSLTGGATPAGANTQVQFNNSGALGASANFTWASDTLTVTGDILFTGVARDLSDARRKDEITRITGALDKINALNGVSFIMKDDERRDVEMGLIAQDVEKVFPELVFTTADGTMALNYQGMVGPLVEAVKELDAKNTELDAENTELRAALDALSSRIDALEGKPQPRSRSNSYRFNQ